MTKECKQQFTLRITRANPTQLVVILYEMLLVYLDEAELSFEKEDTEAGKEAVRKSRGCLNELLQSLNPAYAPACELQQLYLFCIRRLTYAQIHTDSKALDEIRRVIRPLCEAYRQIENLDPKGPVMNNSQEVYAGLTYGRQSLTENMADQGSNRGMLA